MLFNKKHTYGARKTNLSLQLYLSALFSYLQYFHRMETLKSGFNTFYGKANFYFKQFQKKLLFFLSEAEIKT